MGKQKLFKYINDRKGFVTFLILFVIPFLKVLLHYFISPSSKTNLYAKTLRGRRRYDYDFIEHFSLLFEDKMILFIPSIIIVILVVWNFSNKIDKIISSIGGAIADKKSDLDRWYEVETRYIPSKKDSNSSESKFNFQKEDSQLDKNETDKYKKDSDSPGKVDVLGKTLYKKDVNGLKEYFKKNPNMGRVYDDFTWSIRNGSTVRKFLNESNLLENDEIRKAISLGFTDVVSFLKDMLEINENAELRKDLYAFVEASKILLKIEKEDIENNKEEHQKKDEKVEKKKIIKLIGYYSKEREWDSCDKSFDGEQLSKYRHLELESEGKKMILGIHHFIIGHKFSKSGGSNNFYCTEKINDVFYNINIEYDKSKEVDYSFFNANNENELSDNLGCYELLGNEENEYDKISDFKKEDEEYLEL